MKEHQDISREYQHLEDLVIEKRKIKQLLRISPKVTKDNLVMIDHKTWILKRNGETKEQAKERYINKLPEIKRNLFKSRHGEK